MNIVNPPAPSPVISGAKNRKFVLLLIAGIGIIASGAAAYFFYGESGKDTPGAFSSELSKRAEITNPVRFFYENFSTKDYRVEVIDKNEPEYSFYYEKGVLVRIDGKGTYNSGQFTIIKNGKLYSVDNDKKVFVEMDLDNPQSTYILTLYKAGALLDPILQGETPNASPWVFVRQDPENANLSEYQANGRKFLPLLPGSPDLVDIKILLDTDNGLIASASIKTPKDADWNWVRFQYEEVSDIGSLKKFPMDYRKVDPI